MQFQDDRQNAERTAADRGARQQSPKYPHLARHGNSSWPSRSSGTVVRGSTEEQTDLLGSTRKSWNLRAGYDAGGSGRVDGSIHYYLLAVRHQLARASE